MKYILKPKKRVEVQDSGCKWVCVCLGSFCPFYAEL